MSVNAFSELVKKTGKARQVGENGHAVVSLEGLGDDLLGLFDKLIRGQQQNFVQESVRDLVQKAAKHSDASLLRNLFLLAFQTRSCRGGKGEKTLFLWLFETLYQAVPQVALDLLDLIPEYGYWKDLFLLLKDCSRIDGNWEELHQAVWDLCAKQHKADLELVAKAPKDKPIKGLSLYAKFVPSEKSHFDKRLKAVNEIARRVYGDVEEKKMIFRNDVSALRKALNVTERLMCAKQFSQIKFDAVPSKCLTINTLAFLNEKKGGCKESDGNRFPDDEDRVKARHKFVKTLTAEKKVKGAQMFPHELSQKVSSSKSTMQRLVLEAQWESMRDKIEERIAARKEYLAGKVDNGTGAKPVDLGNVVVMADVSGSMSGTPMEVAVSMGVLCSEITHPSFRNLVMTFSAEPTWVHLNEADTLTEKLRKVRRAPWGMNTNFYKALEQIGEVVRVNKLKQEEIPNLLVISDMQFDSCGGSNFAAAKIKKFFHKLGKEVHGKPLDPPCIIFWNVRASVGFPAEAGCEGVVLVSGYSPALFKFLLSGELEEEDVQVDEDTGEVKVVKRKVTPAEMLAKVLADPHLDAVRERLNAYPDDKLLELVCTTSV